MDVAAWLRQLGLERYEQAFRENEIDAGILPTLTSEDLKDIGVTIVGHRRKLLNAIGTLGAEGETQAKPSTLAEPEARREAGTQRRSEAGRRQLTVMFCDLVGSTELSGRLDPEDLREVIRAYQDTAAEVVRRWDGHIAKFLGDGALVYFGYPQAHEDDSERSVRAGLELVKRVGRLSAGDGSSLAARVGIATGLVVVGDLLGEDEDAVAGETPNLAARVQTLAFPGTVVVASSTRSLLGGLFDLADLGAHQLKGFAEPVQAWRVAGESRAESRFEALRGRHVTPLVGREQELAILLERWSWAKEGDGQVVLLPGEPGIGKSRLVRALCQHLADEPHLALSHFCSPYHTNSAFYPVIAQLERAAGLARDDPPEAQLAKIESLLSTGSTNLDEVVPLITALMSLPSDERYPPLALSPQRQKERTLEVLFEQLETLAAIQPVLEVYEDTHWIDPSTLELLDLVVERVRRLPVLVLITYRPEFVPPWSGQAHVTTLAMNRLGRRQGAAMVDRLTGGKALPDTVLDQILAKTDGVPLFVEELTKAVLESGLLTDAGDRYTLAGPLAPLAIPATLQDSLMARLDRLAQVREVAQIGAVIGREFAHKLLAAVSALPEDRLDQALDQLVASELVFRRGIPPEAIYSFKHALVQDAAYQSLLRAKRQQLHGRVAEILHTQFPTVRERQPEILAYHFSAAGLAAAAAAYFLAAGKKAVNNNAPREAENHLQSGLGKLDEVPQSQERTRLKLSLSVSLASVFIATRGPQSKDTQSVYDLVSELAEEVDDPESACFALHGAWQAYTTAAANHELAADVARKMLSIAQKQSEKNHNVIMGLRYLASSLFFLGFVKKANRKYEDAIRLINMQPMEDNFIFYSFDIPATAKSLWSIAQWVAGYPDRSERLAADALQRANAIKHSHTEAFVLHYARNVLLTMKKDFVPAHEFTQRSIELSNDHGFPHWRALATVLRGAASVLATADRSGCQIALDGLKDLDEVGWRLFRSFFLTAAASAHAYIGQIEAAKARLEEAHECSRVSDERWAEAEVWRVEGEVLVSQARLDDAEHCYRRAIEIACKQDAKSWELRASSSLARLWRDQGKRTQARECLAPVYNWFTEGFNTADLTEAKALLDELS